jgi:lipopolysaccharide heptosyltransferase II
MKSTPLRETPDIDVEMISRLAAGGFDGAVIFTVFSQNPLPAALMCYLAKIPRRLAHCRENPYQLLTDWIKETEPEQGIRHEVQRQLDLVRSVGYEVVDEHLSIKVPKPARARVTELVEKLLAGAGRWCVVHPGASAASRRYPPHLFARVLEGLARFDFVPVLWGSPEELPLTQSIIADAKVDAVNLAGELSLAELAALYALAPVVLSNNTGPAHIAAAVGAPIVDLYALTNPQHTPWAVPNRVLSHDVPCCNCFKSVCPHGHNACLSQIDPDEVVAAVVGLFEEIHIREGREEYVHARHQCSIS